ncbi:hypothetical protein JTB14_000941 [Gonioctena quinquepunctata]|nr:hypothetical protein JTB14_000941 [Gonioctena quinquepunctata]
MTVRLNALLLVVLINTMAAEKMLDGNILDEISPRSFLEMHIPTISSKNLLCQNHSRFYMQELRKYTLWATEMFDATSKLPTGFLYGSSYDFGNFDECLRIRVPYDGGRFSGKYCMAKFTLDPPRVDSFIPRNRETHSEYEIDYGSYANISVWERINNYLADDSRSPRNVLHFAFCLPSSCSEQDLENTLKEQVGDINDIVNFTLSVEVKQGSCQIEGEFSLDRSDIIFISIILIAIVNVVSASVYDYVTGQDDLAQYKLSSNLHESILCFSFQRNFKKLTSVSTGGGELDCIAGMKVYSMILIILLHRNMFDFGAAVSNIETIEEYYSRFELTFILNGPILVDTFFTISGFLATYLAMHYYYKIKNKINILYLYFHRYMRMAPTYAVILAFYCTLFVKLGNGPLWQERISSEQMKCREVWWANLLFINNYYDTKNYCMFQSWYMACDMNAFMVVPVICLILYRKPNAGVLAILLLIIASIITIFITVYHYDELPILLLYIKILLSPNTDSTFLRVYIPGHMRASSYFVGILAGYCKYRMNLNNHKLSKGWVSTLFSALYACLHHFCWSLGISWMLIAISSGYGHWVNPLLSWSPLVILSRLTYTVYLCHGAIQMFSAGLLRQPIYASTFNTIHSVAGDIILAYILAFILTILFEGPLIGLEKVIFWRDREKNASEAKHRVDSATELPTLN